MTPIVDVASWLQSWGAIGSFVLLVIKATLIFAIARLVIAANPRASAATRHITLTAALFGVLLLPILTFVAPTWHLGILPNADEAQQVKRIGTTGDEDEAPTALEAAVTVARATGIVAQERITAMSELLQAVKSSWQGLVLLAIGAVSFALLIRMVFGVIGVALVARRASVVTDDQSLRELDAACDHLRLERDVRLLRSADISMPVVWGLTQPVLLLPMASETWSAERLRVVLLHELAHVKRWDGATLLLTRAAVATFWFHPMAWSLERIARSECERACDDLVLESGAKPSDYAEHLLAIARALPHTDPFRSVTLAMTRRSQLEGRLLSILEPKPRRGGFSTRLLSSYAAAALLLLIPLASVRLVAAPPEKPQREVARDEAVVEIGPSVAAKVASTPEMLLAGLEKLKKKRSSTPEDGSEWYGHAYDLYREDKYEEAIAAFQKSIEHGHRVAASKYNIACSYALMGDENNALYWLDHAIAAGWDDFDHIAEDSDFDPIRTSPRFQQLIARTGGQGEATKHARRVEDTLDRYDDMRADGSADGGEWFQVGFDLLRLRRLDESIAAFENAARLDAKSSTALYNIACAYSLKGDVRASADALRRAVEQGFDNGEKILNDPDLRTLRSSANVSELVQMAEDLKLHTGWEGKWDGLKWLFKSNESEAWAEMLPHFVSMTRKYPNLGRSWFNLGYAQLQAGQNDQSAGSFQKAMTLGYRPAAAAYNTACAYARAGQNDLAFQWLEKARANGFKLHGYLEDDDDLDSLHDDPRWRELKRQVRVEKKEKVHVEVH